MTQPRITFTQLYEGSTLADARLGQLIVGRVNERGNKGAWICWLPTPTGMPHSSWREEKSLLAAKNALTAKVLDWLRLAGVVE